jgi:hypothetical protein
MKELVQHSRIIAFNLSVLHGRLEALPVLSVLIRCLKAVT